MPDERRRYPRWMVWMAGRKWGSWLARIVFTPLDKLVYKLTKGRCGLSPKSTVLMLTTTGRRSGLRRKVPVVYLREGNLFWVMASNFGQEHHPGWSFNLLANPQAQVDLGDLSAPVRARLANEQEKRAKWPQLLEVYPSWSQYATWTDRDFRLFCLEPIELDASLSEEKR